MDGHGGDVSAESLIERIQALWVPRDQLEEWHRTLGDPATFARKLRGLAVRFLAADMTYKVGWVYSYEPNSVEAGRDCQPQDCLVVDAGQGASEIVLLRNVSNSKFKPSEVHPQILGKLRDELTSRLPSQVMPRDDLPSPAPLLDPHVLMISADGSIEGKTEVSAVVSQATAEDPDTPRRGIAPVQPFSGLPDQEMISRNNTGTYQHMQQLEKGSAANSEDEQWLKNIIDMTAQMSHSCGKRGGGVSKPYYVSQVLQLCKHAESILQRENMLMELKSPMYVFGDIHGNYNDLSYFLDKLVPFGEIRCTAAHLLFLGDYVDRGENGVECTVHLLALKCLARRKITLLRGNHEAPEVNGDVAEYGGLSFRHECHRKFGESKGEDVWLAFNNVFRLLPGAAIIDKKVFACHGGIPRYEGGPDDRLDMLRRQDFPRLPEIQSRSECEGPFIARCRQIMEDLVWSDPACQSEMIDKYGFGDNRRGPGLKTFGSKAVDNFLQKYGFSHIFRAHQEKSNGLRISDNGRVVTIFSTSDYVGHQNGAGIVYLGDGSIRMIIKRPPQMEPEGTTQQLGSPPRRRNS